MLKVQRRCSKRSRNEFDDAAIVIKAAAVADYRPKEIHPQKMKKQAGDSVIELERTTDILKTLGAMKTTIKSLSVLLLKLKMQLNMEWGNWIVKILIILSSTMSRIRMPDSEKIRMLSRYYQKMEQINPFQAMPKKELAIVLLETIIEEESDLDT